MNARGHTQRMLGWFQEQGIGTLDAAVRHRDGRMIWQRNSALPPGLLAWARAQNVRGADVYVRPARGEVWPVVLLDDVAPAVAMRIAGKYRALCVRTSAVGGCHVWLACTRELTEQERALAQRWLAPRAGADPASTSGEHLGRLAGFRNWKRAGEWVNVTACSGGRAWEPILEVQMRGSDRASVPVRCATTAGADLSQSAKEWGWVCGALEAGCQEDWIHQQLLARAAQRRGADAERYARRTLERARRYILQ